MTAELPDEFTALTPWLDWALPSERARLKKCQTSPMAEVQGFYDAMSAQVDDALSQIGAVPLDDLSPPQRTLLLLCLAYVEAAVAVEMYGEPHCPYVCSVDELSVCNEPFDYDPHASEGATAR